MTRHRPVVPPGDRTRRPPFFWIALVLVAGFALLFGRVTLDVMRAGTVGAMLAWALVFLLLAAGFGAAGGLMGLARPGNPTARAGFVASLLTAVFMLGVAGRPGAAIPTDALGLALGAVFPLHLVAAWHFLDRFPVRVPRSRRWALAGGVLTGAGLLVWAGRAGVQALRALGADPVPEALNGVAGALAAYAQRRQAPGELIYAAAATAGAFAALARNYRILPEGNDRRRIRLVVWGIAAAVAPGFLTSLVAGIAVTFGVHGGARAALRTATLAANAFTLIAPITFVYAMLKHRVLGVSVVVRLGLQHMLATSSLRALVLVPLAWLALQLVAHRDRPLGQLLVSGASGANLGLLVLIVAGLRFRAPLTEAIDRRFFREAYDQEQVLLRLVDAVKQSDSLERSARVVCQIIEAALHVTDVTVMSLRRGQGSYAVVHATAAGALGFELPADSPLPAHLARGVGLDAAGLRAVCPPRESDWLERLGTDLVVPSLGMDGAVVGMLLLGEKRSEEPFTAKDRNLLQMVAAQIGSSIEVLTLRETVNRQRRTASQVLGRLDQEGLNLVRECPVCARCFDRVTERCDADGAALEFVHPVERLIDGKYRLDRRIGRGGMGAVFEAQDLRLERRVAVKVVTGAVLGDLTSLRRFNREAQALARLEHPNIVRVYDFGPLAAESAYLVMEYLPGETWGARLDREGAFSADLTAALLDQVLDGLEAAHAAGVLHRDLKPENLHLLTAEPGGIPRVRILDFGLAKFRDREIADPKSRTTTGVALGTYGYMSPEQLLGQEVDERADVYSVGVVTLESLTGRLPVRGEYFHYAVEAAVEERMVRAAVTATQHALATVVRRALEHDPALRFPSVAELRGALIPALKRCEPPFAAAEGGAPPV